MGIESEVRFIILPISARAAIENAVENLNKKTGLLNTAGQSLYKTKNCLRIIETEAEIAIDVKATVFGMATAPAVWDRGRELENSEVENFLEENLGGLFNKPLKSLI